MAELQMEELDNEEPLEYQLKFADLRTLVESRLDNNNICADYALQAAMKRAMRIIDEARAAKEEYRKMR